MPVVPAYGWQMMGNQVRNTVILLPVPSKASKIHAWEENEPPFLEKLDTNRNYNLLVYTMGTVLVPFERTWKSICLSGF